MHEYLYIADSVDLLFPFNRFAYHCTVNGGCYFDCCLNCFREHETPLHAHPLVRADSHVVYSRFAGGWRCDNCGSVHKGPDDNKPWHCQICDFDLCNSCMNGERQDQGIVSIVLSVGFSPRDGVLRGKKDWDAHREM